MSANVEFATISLNRGDHYRAVFTAKKYAAETPDVGELIDLTNYGVVFTARKNRSDAGSPVIELTAGTGVTLLAQAGATLGKFALEFATATTQNLDLGGYDFDLYVVAPTPAMHRHPVLEGKLLIKQGVGRP